MDRKLASIQKIESLEPLYLLQDGSEALNIEMAHVLGWKLVVKKGEFQVGDLCVYFETDSILPDEEWSAFLKSKRIKIMKLNKMKDKNGNTVVSQGLALPVEIIRQTGFDEILYVGMDMTELLGVTKWEVTEEWTKATGAKGGFHPSVPKTDEKRIQSYPEVLIQMCGLPYYITQKLDGTSCTVLCEEGNDAVHVYSRNLEVGEDSNYYKTALEQGVIDAAKTNPGLAFQGEIVGPNIQGNKLKKTKNEMYIFNIYDFVNANYLFYELFLQICKENNLKTVPIVTEGMEFNYNIDQLEWLARAGWYDAEKTSPQGGIVIRPKDEQYSSALGGRLSFKVISEDFLLNEAK